MTLASLLHLASISVYGTMHATCKAAQHESPPATAWDRGPRTNCCISQWPKQGDKANFEFLPRTSQKPLNCGVTKHCSNCFDAWGADGLGIKGVGIKGPHTVSHEGNSRKLISTELEGRHQSYWGLCTLWHNQLLWIWLKHCSCRSSGHAGLVP